VIYTHLGCGARRTAFDVPVGKNGQLQVRVHRARTDGEKQLYFPSSPPAQEKELIDSLNDKLNSGVVHGTAAF
jgi:hypothetical protein